MMNLIYVVYHLSQNIFRLRRTRASRANSGIQRISMMNVIMNNQRRHNACLSNAKLLDSSFKSIVTAIDLVRAPSYREIYLFEGLIILCIAATILQNLLSN